MLWEPDAIGTEPPTLEFHENQTPFSKKFDDIYFSKISGVDESLHNFILQHDFKNRWSEKSDYFSILELGFGTGLNFLLSYKHWQENRSNCKRLHYLACEVSPIKKHELGKIHSNWPELSYYSNKLLEKLPENIQGFHRVSFLDDNIELTLLYGDARKTLKKLNASIDAFYLDGFSPKKNSELWSKEIFCELSRLSSSKTTLSSFSSSSEVRKNLEKNNFIVEKKPGFAHKREMLTARLCKEKTKETTLPKKVIVVGAGLAGTSVAAAFLKRGIAVHLIEEKNDIALGSSGNQSAIIMPHISASPDLRTRLSFSGFNYSRSLILGLEKQGFITGYNHSGVFRLPNSNRLKTVLDKLEELKIDKETARKLSKEETSSILGIEVNTEALYYPTGAYVNPRQLCNSLLKISDNLKLSLNKKIKQIIQTESGWEVYADKEDLVDSAEILVIANANHARELKQTAHIRLEPVRGQVVLLPESSQTKNLKSVLCYDGYIAPSINGLHMLGATFEHEEDHAEVCPKKTINLVERLNNYLKEPLDISDYKLKGRVSFRSTTPDHLPIIGKLNDPEKFRENYRAVKYRNVDFENKNNWHPGLYVSLGHGSQGVITCPLAGEVIACDVLGEPMPMDEDLIRFTNPLRFQVRELNSMS